MLLPGVALAQLRCAGIVLVMMEKRRNREEGCKCKKLDVPRTKTSAPEDQLQASKHNSKTTRGANV